MGEYSSQTIYYCPHFVIFARILLLSPHHVLPNSIHPEFTGAGQFGPKYRNQLAAQGNTREGRGLRHTVGWPAWGRECEVLLSSHMLWCTRSGRGDKGTWIFSLRPGKHLTLGDSDRQLSVTLLSCWAISRAGKLCDEELWPTLRSEKYQSPRKPWENSLLFLLG